MDLDEYAYEVLKRQVKEHAMSNASNSTGCEDKCLKKTIHGYDIELDLFEENGEPRSDCSVTRTVKGVEYGGSLAMMEGFGTLEDYHTGDEHVVSKRHQAAISKWAERNGY